MSLNLDIFLSYVWNPICLQGENGYSLKPRECPLGTRLLLAYEAGIFPPCVYAWNTDIGYKCTRASIQAATSGTAVS